MRITFNIARLNCYRLLSEVVDEALRLGHHVECWHNAGAKGLGVNTASKDCAPRFHHGTPVNRNYRSPAEFLEWVKDRRVDAIVNIFPPFKEILADWPERGQRPLFVLLDAAASDTVFNVNSSEMLYAIDLFALQTKYYRDVCARMMAEDWAALFASEQSKGEEVGPIWEEIVRRHHRWEDQHVQYFLDHSVCVGTPALDVVGRLDPQEIRRRWGIPAAQPVVGLLVCPFGTDPRNPLWEKLFMSRSTIGRLAAVLRARRFNRWREIFSAETNRDVIKALHSFCRREDALLVAKMRHSRRPDPDIVRFADKILGEDGYHPHTALELYAISSMTVGFYSTGAIESVALGAPYININISDFPKNFFFRLNPTFSLNSAWRSIVYEVEAAGAKDAFRSFRLKNLDMESAVRRSYLNHYAGPMDGRSSARLLDAIENMALRNPLPVAT